MDQQDRSRSVVMSGFLMYNRTMPVKRGSTVQFQNCIEGAGDKQWSQEDLSVSLVSLRPPTDHEREQGLNLQVLAEKYIKKH